MMELFISCWNSDIIYANCTEMIYQHGMLQALLVTSSLYTVRHAAMITFKLQVCTKGDDRDQGNINVTTTPRKHIFLNVAIIK